MTVFLLCDSYVDKIRSDLKKDVALEDQIKRIIRHHLDLYLDNSALARIIFHELSSSLEDEVQEKIQQIHREYIGFLIVIADMMGIPAQDQDRFKEWSDALVGNDYERYVWCQREMTSYFTHIAEERRRDPQDDPISRLVQATADGEPLQPVQLISFCILMLVSGNETTTNLLSLTLLCFDSRRDAWHDIHQDRSLLANAIEEVLRYCSPVQMMNRQVKRDTELDGFTFHKGQNVKL